MGVGTERRMGDTELAELAENFETFYERERRKVLAFAAALTGDWAVAEDLSQEAFAAAHQHWDTLHTPSAWVRRVIANRSVSRWRKLGRETRALARIGTASDVVTLEEPDHEFWAAVRALPARQSQVIALRYLDDLSMAQIAELLEISEGSVKSSLSHARRNLAAALGIDQEEAS
jgi:RNA polymerase sigma-70 factor (ECF subfamily)